MTNQPPLGGAPRDELAESVRTLTRRIEVIDTALQARTAEAETLSPLIERVVSRVADIRELLRTIQPQVERATADIQDLRSRVEMGPDSGNATQALAVDRLADMDRRLQTLERPDNRSQQAALDRLTRLERRLDALGQPDSVEQQTMSDRIAQIEQRLDAAGKPDDGWRQWALERLANLEQRLDTVSNEYAQSGPQTNELLEAIDTRINALDATEAAAAAAAAARLERLEQPMDSFLRTQEIEVPAAIKRIDALEARLEALTGGGEPIETGLQRAKPAGAEGEESALQVLREESIGIAMASVNDLYRRVDQLDRQEEALSRIINLIVERSKLIPADDLAGERARNQQ